MEAFDTKLFLWIFSFSGQGPILDNVIVFCAEYLPYVLLIAFGAFILDEVAHFHQRARLLTTTLLTMCVSYGVFVQGIRMFYHHARPFVTLGFIPLIQESSYSFPSGHTTFFFAVSAVVFMEHRKTGTIFFVSSFIMAIARIMAGVHYPFDILGGILIGTCVGIAIDIFVRRVFIARGITPVDFQTSTRQ